MNQLWIGQWAMELAGEAAVYAHIYEVKLQARREGIMHLENWMDKWMQYRILRYIGEKMGACYKTVTFNPEFSVVEPEKLLYNEKDNCNQFQALYENVEESWRPLMVRVMTLQQSIVQRCGNGG